ncbi:hypothetical protein BC629DRAFT_1541315 [Irpex lacteus]|nr:hypothetical protein BC629DRAFT_1541315 [Irpex lacteus]
MNLEAQNTDNNVLAHAAPPRKPFSSSNTTTAAAGEPTSSVPQTNMSASGDPLSEEVANVEALIDSAVSGAAPGESTNTSETRTPGHTEKRMKVGKVLLVKENAPMTARNIAAIRWKKDNFDGLDKQFTAYWKLVSEDIRKKLDKGAKDLKKAGKALGMELTATTYAALQRDE